MTVENTQALSAIEALLSSASLNTTAVSQTPMVADAFSNVEENCSEENRLLASLAALMANAEVEDFSAGFNKSIAQRIIDRIDNVINDQVNEIMHQPEFKHIESQFTSLADLVKDTNFQANIRIDFLDASKDELAEDFECNSVDIAGASLFKKVYIAEYDQYGGEPYGSIVGLYEFDRSNEDLDWLSTMGKISVASHAPFVSAVKPQFFGCDSVEELSQIKDLEGLMNHPKFGNWNKFRKTEQATYVGLTLPRYVLRLPYDPEINPANKGLKGFKEDINPLNDHDYLWGSSAILFAKNLTKSFERSGWCQHIRGPKAGGMVENLATHTFDIRGKEEAKPPVEFVIPDYREFEFAKCGFIPLVYNKGTTEACFFSAQSAKYVETFEDPKDSENAQMISNLSYTYSITRIAHYVKSVMRDNIGSTADGAYIQNQLSKWLNDYVTAVTDPDDVTLQRFPFKTANIEVNSVDGKIGWYNCKISVLPHLQFEGMDAELKLDSRLA
ncbi:type VI secretion system contractile sheath large subunit [Cysteiniphilum sp. 6C5]|uniref:type VI secretion system contractile sheath large subunit n=1 Tax=unclassified Cysteiniphilum TaxID=2610889 RepID=UPI003F82CA04